MKLFLILVAAGAVFAGGYYNKTEFREKVRGFLLSSSDLARYRIYQRAKNAVRSDWEGSPNAEFEAWGDDAGEKVVPIDDTTYLASGHVVVTLGPVKMRRPWAAFLEKYLGPKPDFAVGDDALTMVELNDRGELKDALAKVKEQERLEDAAAELAGTSADQPAPDPGAWMWKHVGTLDKPAHH